MKAVHPSARPEEVFARRASKYATSKVHDDRVTLSWLVDAASPAHDEVALDIGTGAGHTALALAPRVRKVEAIDVTEEMLREARKLARKRGIENVDFHTGDAMALPYGDRSFDIVTCRRAAHHFTDLEQALGEMARVLKLGGRLVIDDRSVPEDEEVDELINRMDALHDPSHVRDRSPCEWSSLIRTTGLEPMIFRPYRRRIPLSHFTDMVDPRTESAMCDLVAGASEHAKGVLALEITDGCVLLDNFFVLISAFKAR
ncbi:MAG: methyltransferase domain-containing protein [Methanomassiliicoccus sp.]|nr:methyltransferase domain-containing protein [Methanomassiliicoccus sp.]